MRYLPLTPADRGEMLGVIGAADIDALFADVPAAARLPGPVDLPRTPASWRWSASSPASAALNRPAGAGPFFCGAGAYRHHVPATVDHIIQRSEFLTSYTPYQPEIAQGTLQVLFEFQTQVAALTGPRGRQLLDVRRVHGLRRGGDDGPAGHAGEKAILSGGVHPHYAATTQTIAHAEGMEIVRQAGRRSTPRPRSSRPSTRRRRAWSCRRRTCSGWSPT
jgi:glycine dehydrogenase subunit 1